MDYRDMLLRYMKMVDYLEGTTFVHGFAGEGFGFTKEETAELLRIDDEIQKIRKAGR